MVAFLLYQLLKLIRGTQAVQLLLGLAVIFAVGWAAQLLHLRLLEFIFNNGTQAIVIAAIVLFQPELRRALDQVGRLGTVRAVLGRHPELAYARTVDEVLRAAGSLAERKVGALIVFERETGLENLAATGVHVDGEVTGEMLATIFIPGSPLHDGAVIIRESRIVAAGCVLPLAETLPGVGRMGTRHRAALGLTMQSDAVVLIVSEETGLISVAHDGKIYRGLDQAKLHEMLVTLLTKEGGSGRAAHAPSARQGRHAAHPGASLAPVKFPGFIRRNWQLKVGCFLIAFVTWVGVVYAGNPPETKVISLPVPQSAANIPPAYTLVHPVDNVLVRVGGDQNTLDSLNPDVLNVTRGLGGGEPCRDVLDSDVDYQQPTRTSSSSLRRPPCRSTSIRSPPNPFRSPFQSRNPPPVGYERGTEQATPSTVTVTVRNASSPVSRRASPSTSSRRRRITSSSFRCFSTRRECG